MRQGLHGQHGCCMQGSHGAAGQTEGQQGVAGQELHKGAAGQQGVAHGAGHGVAHGLEQHAANDN